MNCSVIQDLLPLYADGLASDESRKLIEEHIKTCEICRNMAEQMSCPIEQDITAVPDPLEALRKQKRKNRRRVIIACICTVFVVLLCYWMYMETHFRGSMYKTVSTDRELILSEMPDLKITQNEFDLSHTVFELPPVKELSENEMSTAIPYEEMEDYISEILPDNAEIHDAGASKYGVYVGYRLDGKLYYISYFDTDLTGNTDLIRKEIFVPKGNDPIHTAYKTEFAGETHITYKKQVSRHIWFGFLQTD